MRACGTQSGQYLASEVGCYKRGVRIPRSSMENSLWKLIKKFEHHPTVGSIDTDLLSRYFVLVGGMAPTVCYRWVVQIP